MRGEDCINLTDGAVNWETPPHAWGRLWRRCTHDAYGGNTPTCVGKTYPEGRGFIHMVKHPHMRGEDFPRLSGLHHHVDTRPHAWGRLSLPSPLLSIPGNTPTCVGKTQAASEWRQPHEKHPHMRGEDNIPVNTDAVQLETPPHAWGRPCLCSSFFISFRNTPTCVGKTPIY